MALQWLGAVLAVSRHAHIMYARHAVHSKAVDPPPPSRRSASEATAFKFDKNRLSFHSDQVRHDSLLRCSSPADAVSQDPKLTTQLGASFAATSDAQFVRRNCEMLLVRSDPRPVLQVIR